MTASSTFRCAAICLAADRPPASMMREIFMLMLMIADNTISPTRSHIDARCLFMMIEAFLIYGATDEIFSPIFTPSASPALLQRGSHFYADAQSIMRFDTRIVVVPLPCHDAAFMALRQRDACCYHYFRLLQPRFSSAAYHYSPSAACAKIRDDATLYRPRFLSG